jgi:hypothetical protein
MTTTCSGYIPSEEWDALTEEEREELIPQETTSVVSSLEFGDSGGHPFHGNQYVQIPIEDVKVGDTIRSHGMSEPATVTSLTPSSHRGIEPPDKRMERQLRSFEKYGEPNRIPAEEPPMIPHVSVGLSGPFDEVTLPVGTGLKVEKYEDTGLVDRVREEGGITYDPHTGTEPTDGYIVAKEGIPSTFVPTETFLHDDAAAYKALDGFLTEHAAEYDDPSAMVGIWRDGEEVVLDVVEKFDNLDEATQAGIDRNQQSGWDVVKGETFDTGGTGR